MENTKQFKVAIGGQELVIETGLLAMQAAGAVTVSYGDTTVIHFGTHDDRTDKFYNGYMEKMIKTLKRKGYVFTPLREAVGF